MQRNRRSARASLALYLLYLMLVVTLGLAVELWIANGRQMSLRDLFAPFGAGGGDEVALAETMPPTATATPRPTMTPLPTATALAPTPTPVDVWPPAARPPTWIKAPAIDLDAPVVEIGFKTTYIGDTPVTEWQLPANAAGFHRDTAYPGNPGNTVLSGHNNIQGEVFRYLVDLEPGDEVFLYVGDTVYRYVVSSKEVIPEKGMPAEVRIANAQRIAPGGEERLTLVTCWPYTGNSHRVIVVAMPAPLETP